MPRLSCACQEVVIRPSPPCFLNASTITTHATWQTTWHSARTARSASYALLTLARTYCTTGEWACAPSCCALGHPLTLRALHQMGPIRALHWIHTGRQTESHQVCCAVAVFCFASLTSSRSTAGSSAHSHKRSRSGAKGRCGYAGEGRDMIACSNESKHHSHTSLGSLSDVVLTRRGRDDVAF